MILSVSTTPPPSALSLVAPLYVNNTLIERVQSYKYLGVHVDPKLSFDLHFRNKVASAKRMLGCLSRVVRKHVPSIIAKVYMAVIRPSLLYAIPISYPYYERDKCALEKVQKYACKLSLNRFNLPYDTMLRELKWLKITKFVFQSGIFLMYKYVNMLRILPALCIIFESDTGFRRSNRLSNGANVVLKQFSHTRSLTSFIYHFGNVWNGISREIIEMPYVQFCRAIKSSSFRANIWNVNL